MHQQIIIFELWELLLLPPEIHRYLRKRRCSGWVQPDAAWWRNGIFLVKGNQHPGNEWEKQLNEILQLGKQVAQLLHSTQEMLWSFLSSSPVATRPIKSSFLIAIIICTSAMLSLLVKFLKLRIKILLNRLDCLTGTVESWSWSVDKMLMSYFKDRRTLAIWTL